MHAVGRAVHALSALGVGLLAVAGTSRHERAVAASNRRRKRRGAKPDQGGPPPSPAPTPASPDSVAAEPAGESPETALLDAEAKKGKPGPTGPAGATGPTGAAGPISTTFVAGGALLPATRFETVFAEVVCPEGSQVIVGGFDTSVDGALSNEVKVDSALAFSEIDDVRARYRVVFTRAATDSENSIVVFAFAVCSP